MDQANYSIKSPGYFKHSRPEMHEFIPQTTQTLLEIGCGNGDFVRGLKAHREIHTTGVEPVAQAADFARQHFNEVLCVEANEGLNLLIGRRFDCIVFNDVLEHLSDPWETIRRCRPMLNEGGCIVASIPNIRHWPVLNSLFLGGRWDYVEAGVLDKTHLRFFTKLSINDFFTSCGYTLSTLVGINGSPLPWKIRIVNRLLGGRFDDTMFPQFACVARPK